MVGDWARVNKQVPRLVDSLPNGPEIFPTVLVFMAGGVPEVMLHLRKAGLLDTSVKTASACTLDEVLNWWEGSERRFALRKQLEGTRGDQPCTRDQVDGQRHVVYRMFPGGKSGA